MFPFDFVSKLEKYSHGVHEIIFADCQYLAQVILILARNNISKVQLSFKPQAVFASQLLDQF